MVKPDTPPDGQRYDEWKGFQYTDQTEFDVRTFWTFSMYNHSKVSDYDLIQDPEDIEDAMLTIIDCKAEPVGGEMKLRSGGYVDITVEVRWTGTMNGKENMHDSIPSWLIRWQDNTPYPCDAYTGTSLLNYTASKDEKSGDISPGQATATSMVESDVTFNGRTYRLFAKSDIRNSSGDTLARANTTMVGYRERSIHLRDTVEEILVRPNHLNGHHFHFTRGESKMDWNPVPRGRRYQPIITFYYKHLRDTCSITIPGNVKAASGTMDLISNALVISESRFLSIIKNQLKDNKDTLKKVNLRGGDVIVESTPVREDFYAVQTPQGFRYKELLQCYEHAAENHITATDDTALAEAVGIEVFLAKGSYSNIKITTPEDIAVAYEIIRTRGELEPFED